MRFAPTAHRKIKIQKERFDAKKVYEGDDSVVAVGFCSNDII